MALGFNENTRYTFHVLIQSNPAHSARQYRAAKSIPVELQTLLLEKGPLLLHVYLQTKHILAGENIPIVMNILSHSFQHV